MKGYVRGTQQFFHLPGGEGERGERGGMGNWAGSAGPFGPRRKERKGEKGRWAGLGLREESFVLFF